MQSLKNTNKNKIASIAFSLEKTRIFVLTSDVREVIRNRASPRELNRFNFSEIAKLIRLFCSWYLLFRADRIRKIFLNNKSNKQKTNFTWPWPKIIQYLNNCIWQKSEVEGRTIDAQKWMHPAAPVKTLNAKTNNCFPEEATSNRRARLQ